jgi:hypothetical protein
MLFGYLIVRALLPMVAVFGRLPAGFSRALASLHRSIDAATAADLARGMHYPARWDPFFTGYMTLADLYRYPTRHYDFHRRQLTLSTAA